MWKLTRNQVIGSAVGSATAAVGAGLLLADFAQSDDFAYYKQSHASAYQAPGPVSIPVVATAPPVQTPAPAAAPDREYAPAVAHDLPPGERIEQDEPLFYDDPGEADDDYGYEDEE